MATFTRSPRRGTAILLSVISVTLLFLLAVPTANASGSTATANPSCPVSSGGRPYKAPSLAQLKYLAGRAIDKRAAETPVTRDQFETIVRRFDADGNGILDRNELEYLTARMGAGNQRSPDDWNPKEVTMVDHLRSVGFQSVAANDHVHDHLAEHYENGITVEHLVEEAFNQEKISANTVKYGSTLTLLERKMDTLGPASCTDHLRLALQILARNGDALPNVECLTVTPANDLCDCFAPVDTSVSVVPASHRLERRILNFNLPILNNGWIRLARDSGSIFSDVISSLLQLREAVAVAGFVAEWGPIIVAIAVVIFVIIELLRFAVSYFNCKPDANDFKGPVAKLTAIGDFVPMNFIAWDPSTPAPTCALAIYISNTCGWEGTADSQSCSNGGELVYPNSCKDIFRYGSCVCGLKCKSKCWKVFQGCCCEALMYRNPRAGRLEPQNGDTLLGKDLTTVEDCAQTCYDSGICAGFSITTTHDNDISKVQCRLSVSDSGDADLVADSASTTWFSNKEAPGAFANGVDFIDIYADLKILWLAGSSGAPAVGGSKVQTALNIIMLSLLAMSGCLERMTFATPDLITTMMTSYQNIHSDFDGSATRLAGVMSTTLTVNPAVVDQCAYFNDPDGLKTVAAMNIFFNSVGVNMFQTASNLRYAALKEGIMPSDGYFQGLPSTGIDKNFKLLTRASLPGWSDMINPTPDPADDTDDDEDELDDDMPDPLPPLEADFQFAPVLGVANSPLSDAITDLCTAFALGAKVSDTLGWAAQKNQPKVPYKWSRLVVVSVGQADAMYQEFTHYECLPLLVGGKTVLWTPRTIRNFPFVCDLIDRRRIWVDGGTHSWQNGVWAKIALTAFLPPVVISGAYQTYMFDEAIITHLDTDHYVAMTSAMNEFRIIYQYFAPNANIFWNNFLDATWRSQTGFTPAQQNPYIDALNYAFKAVGADAQNVRMGSTTQSWGALLTAKNIPLPPGNPYWVGLLAKVLPHRDPDYDADTDNGWDAYTSSKPATIQHIELWNAINREFPLTNQRGYVGGNEPAQFATDLGATTTILWPQPTTLLTNAARCSYGGVEGDGVGATGAGPLRRRMGIANMTETDENPYGPEGAHSDKMVHLEERSVQNDYAAVKNHLSIVTKTTMNGARVVLTGDAISQSLTGIGADAMNCDLFKAPHHGSSNTGQRTDFNGIQADKIIISGRYDKNNPKKPATSTSDPSLPYSTTYLLWIIQSHHASRPDKTLNLYITGIADWPDFPWIIDGTPLRALRDRPGVRPQDCNYNIWRLPVRGAYFGFDTALVADTTEPIYDDVTNAMWVNLGLAANGGGVACDQSWETLTDSY
ncbi:hypothetical protein HKX48_002133 [Thoreauomyces humboldtii]|nr:hypothetical protein HKX48_002133 [Thoreauomyces humboldtii]